MNWTVEDTVLVLASWAALGPCLGVVVGKWLAREQAAMDRQAHAAAQARIRAAHMTRSR